MLQTVFQLCLRQFAVIVLDKRLVYLVDAGVVGLGGQFAGYAVLAVQTERTVTDTDADSKCDD